MNCTFLYPNKFERVTGGHIYEHNLVTILKHAPGFYTKVMYQNSDRSHFFKLFSPFLVLGLVCQLKTQDLIIFNSTKGFYYIPLQWILRNIFKKKTMVIHHHFLNSEFKGIKKWCYWLMEKFFLKSATYVLTPSPYIADIIKEKLNRSAFVNEIPFNKPIIESHSNKTGNQLLYVGTIEKRKGLIYLFEALTLLSQKNIPYVLNIVGKVKDNSYYEDLKRMMIENNLSVNFHGYLSDEELENLYNTSDIFVFPSLLEGFGMAVNEAMCHGLPVIAFNNSALPYSVNSSNGILVPTADSKKLADAITVLIQNASERERLSKGALEHARHLPDNYSFQQKTIRIFNEMIDIKN